MKNRIVSTVLAFAMVLAMIPSAFAEFASEPDKAAQIEGEQYDTLAQAIEAAEDGDTITLLKDVTGFTNEELTGNKNAPVFLIDKDITLDGDGHKLEAGAFTTTRNPIIGVQNGAEGGVQVTIRDLTVVGNADTGHGINVWSQATGGERPSLTLEQVTIQNCGTAAIVVNNAVVTADGLTTSGNAWGAVNVDDAESLFTLTSGQMDEAAQIWTEAQPAGGAPANIQVPESWQYVAVNKDNGEGLSDVKYHLTTDPVKLGEAHNETTNTVYDKTLRALEGAEDGQTVSLMRSVTLESAATVKQGVRLVIREDVTLTGELTNNGVVENHGTLSGSLVNNGSVENSGAIDSAVEGGGQLLSAITFTVTPADAVVTVYDSGSQKVEPSQDKTYELADGAYTYEVSASGYVTKSGSFEVSGAAQTIQVELEEKEEPVEPGDPEYTITVDSAEGGSVTADPGKAAQGETVKLTVQAQEGFELESITVTGPAGAVELTDEGQGVYSFTMPAGNVTVSASFVESSDEPVWDNPYGDVSEDAWYFDYVEYVVQAGLMKGTGEGTFAPDVLGSRGMFATILARLAGVDTEGGETWYEKGMAWAVEHNVSDGAHPEGDITREQAVTMLYRYAGSPAVDGDHLAGFADAGAVADWARDAMNWAVSVGLIQGGDAGLAPQSGATRVELAAMFARFDAIQSA